VSWQTVAKRVSALEQRRAASSRPVFIMNWFHDPEGAAATLAAYRDARARGVTGIVFIQFGGGGAKSRATRVP
jgi:hypothetical protein